MTFSAASSPAHGVGAAVLSVHVSPQSRTVIEHRAPSSWVGVSVSRSSSLPRSSGDDRFVLSRFRAV